MVVQNRGVETAPDGKELFHPGDRAAMRRWLARNSTRDKGLWIATYKTATGRQRVTYDDMVEELLCVGWIDSTSKSLDDRRLHWVSPRRRRSNWSPSNLARVERLERLGLMTDAGRAALP